MKVCSVCGVEKDYSNYGKRAASKDGYNASCSPCRSVVRKGYSSEKEYNKKYREERREDIKVNIKKWRSENREHVNAYKREHRKSNPLMYYYTDSMKTLKRQMRVPKWLTKEHKEEIEKFYWLAKDLEAITGECYQVDHIVPLNGTNVSGLHVPWNLQILPADINNIKNNKYEEW